MVVGHLTYLTLRIGANWHCLLLHIRTIKDRPQRTLGAAAFYWPRPADVIPGRGLRLDGVGRAGEPDGCGWGGHALRLRRFGEPEVGGAAGRP